MPKLISIPTEDGEVLISVRSPGESITAVGVSDDAIQQVKNSLDGALETVSRVAKAFQKVLSDIGENVKESELELGLQFTSKGTIYVVEAEGQAAMKVTIKFEPSKVKPAERQETN